jgi:Fic family protein
MNAEQRRPLPQVGRDLDRLRTRLVSSGANDGGVCTENGPIRKATNELARRAALSFEEVWHSEEVEGLIDDLCRFCDQELLPPLLQAAIAHAQIETIHPFADGNGRTGRALVQVILRRRGIAPTFVPPISVVLARQRNRYIAGLTQFREDRLAEWITIFATATTEAAQLADRYRGRVAELQGRWRERLREGSNPRSDAAAWTIIDVLPAHPIVTVPVAVAATGRTRPAVTNGIDELEAAGILIRLSASRRNRAWDAEGLLDLVVGLESGEG